VICHRAQEKTTSAQLLNVPHYQPSVVPAAIVRLFKTSATGMAFLPGN